jgi:RNA polymerase sigma factor (sigma-70 family)
MTPLAETHVCEHVLMRARRGDMQAQAEIYAAVAPGAFGLIRRIVGGRALAEDLFQETMITVFERLGAFRGEAPLGAWVRQIAVSKCLMYLRSPWHRARLHLEKAAGSDSPLHDGPFPPVSAPPAEILDVERALDSLSPTARAVVWLYDVEGYTHEEIASLFNRTVSFSKSQLARAHERLRAWFEPQAERQPCTPT